MSKGVKRRSSKKCICMSSDSEDCGCPYDPVERAQRKAREAEEAERRAQEEEEEEDRVPILEVQSTDDEHPDGGTSRSSSGMRHLVSTGSTRSVS